jgi:hypothetical protein
MVVSPTCNRHQFIGIPAGDKAVFITATVGAVIGLLTGDPERDAGRVVCGAEPIQA